MTVTTPKPHIDRQSLLTRADAWLRENESVEMLGLILCGTALATFIGRAICRTFGWM